MVLQIIVAVFVLGVIIMIHEWGHFISARSIGIAVQEFSVGIGPALWKKEGKRTLYSVRCIPFGGYCLFDAQIEGEDSHGRPLSLLNRKALSKMYVCLAGPVMNFVLAAFIFTMLFSFIGVTTGYKAVIGEVQPDSPAAAAGILPGDRVLSIEGEELDTWADLSRIIAAHKEEEVLKFRIMRGTEEMILSASPQYLREENRWVIGVIVDKNHPILEKVSPLKGVGMGLMETTMMIGELIEAIAQMVTGQISVGDNLSGPIALAQVVVETTSTGLTNTLFLTGFLSVNLGIMNLLPIPALDGGKIIVYLIELLRRKPLDTKVEGWVNAAGLALILSLMAVLTFKDILNLFRAQ